MSLHLSSMLPGGSKIASVQLITVLVSECMRTLACMQKLGGSGGMILQENFFEVWMLRDGF